jgi:hypothetical protein
MPEEKMADYLAPSERPIESKSHDALERGGLVARIARGLVSAKTGKATGTVIGLSGTWGSGKSSVLNLVDEEIRTQNPNAIIVRFNPWLVSGRNDLIKEFFAELRSAIIKSKHKLGAKSKAVLKTLVEYGTRVSPILDSIPYGSAGKAALKTAESILKESESLPVLRAKLLKELADFPAPIVVIIDEVDRVEQTEVRAIAQLVRSIADFPNVSYLLAYDANRVAEALGDNNPERGRSYLEKIVQLQIPIPMVVAEELTSVVRAELSRMSEFNLPKDFWAIQRYREMETIIVTRIVSTLRDVKRLTGTYRAIYGLVEGEADWVDVLGYATLLSKAPETVENLKANPELVVDNPLSEVEQIRRAREKKLDVDKLFAELIAKHEDAEGLRVLLRFMFPRFKGSRNFGLYVDPLSVRRTLVTVLRLGVVPGAWSRTAISQLARQPASAIGEELARLQVDDKLGPFVDRLDDIYAELQDFDHGNFWKGVAGYLKRGDLAWLDHYTGMVWRIEEFCDLLLKWANNDDRRRAARVEFKQLKDCGEISVVSHWLHHHAFAHGVFGREHRPTYQWFLDGDQTKTETLEIGRAWRELHIKGQLLPRTWDLFPVFVMQGAGLWDEECRAKLTSEISGSDRAVDGMTLMLFGPDYSTDKETVQRFLDIPVYVGRLHERVGQSGLHETVLVAVQRAIELLDPDSEVLGGSPA